MRPPRALCNATIILAAIGGSPAAAFSLTGTYTVALACDSTTAGVPWTWGASGKLHIVQDGDVLEAEFKYTDASELGAEYSAYRGSAVTSGDGSLVSGYMEACGGTFAALELVRFFPASTASEPFNFAADSTWVSSAVPNLPGLTVQACRYSMTRVSTDASTVRSCPPG